MPRIYRIIESVIGVLCEVSVLDKLACNRRFGLSKCTLGCASEKSASSASSAIIRDSDSSAKSKLTSEREHGTI